MTNMEEPCTLERAISSILAFYKLLTQLPYIPPDKLMIPPPTGWETGPETGINETELRRRGKTEEVITTLRHLPYLDQEIYGSHWTLADSTLHINYARGQLYHEWLERDQALLPDLPGHVIWLTEGYERAGVYLLLNVETWEIIEYTILGESIEIDHETYEALPPSRRWMAYSRMPIDRYFDLWRWRYLTLQFVLIPESRRVFKGTAELVFKDPRLLYEENLLRDEDDDVDVDVDYVPDESDSSSASDSESIDDDLETLNQELHLLSLDLSLPSTSTSTSTFTSRIPTYLQPTPHSKKSFLHTHAQPLLSISNPRSATMYQTPWSISLRQDIRELIAIYMHHDWPAPQYEWCVSGRYIRSSGSFERDIESFDLSSFRREQCREAVKQWNLSRRERRAE
jgi:hypothetical protein